MAEPTTKRTRFACYQTPSAVSQTPAAHVKNTSHLPTFALEVCAAVNLADVVHFELCSDNMHTLHTADACVEREFSSGRTRCA